MMLDTLLKGPEHNRHQNTDTLFHRDRTLRCLVSSSICLSLPLQDTGGSCLILLCGEGR